MTQKEQPPDPDMTEQLRDRLDALVREYRRLRKKADHVKSRMMARTSILRHALNEMIENCRDRTTRIAQRREALCQEFMALWAEHLPKVKQVKLPSGAVSKRRMTTFAVLDKEAVIDALDRLDRLDLVDQVIDEKGLRPLVTGGKLADLPETALKVETRTSIQVYRQKG